ncbi:unnamed protein product [Candidula unifasciata]|uniref:Tubby-related protein 4 n=1 Tax=Candidula unifasciata TaxID=100452 RepID=A0A8S3ZW50_9EUPU|nr:unnamed protein product [Candidula unifasciata]
MHVHFEQNTCTRTDSNFLSLSWMGKVPEDLPEEGSGWKLNRAQYYVEGWLASGNARGIVGVTFSTSHCHSYDAPPRSNFNLRGHRSEVILVRWNEPYQKLATCDSRGVIFVWIKHEGRWSIELINDRNSQVTDFAWSHDGRMALICYRDGFILVGSVAGQRYWSSMLNLDNTNVTCGVWSPDDQQVMFGTVDGQIIVMSSAGALVTQVAVHEGFEITSMAWSCEKFNMEEADAGKEGAEQAAKDDSTKSYILAVCFKYGDIFLMSGYDDVCPVMIYTTLTGVKIDWSNCGEYLAVGGFVRLPNLQCRNELHLYSKDGSLIRWVSVPSQGKPLTAMTWGHNDNSSWLTGYPLRLREFVCSPPPGGERLFCTMIRHGEETSGGHYTLYLEYLGGLIPLLKGKRASKLRPDFIIYDPKIKSLGKVEQGQAGAAIESDASSESDADIYTDGCGSPRMQRRRRHKVFRAEKVDRSMTFRTLDELMFDDNLPETNRLVEVTSNIWGTKFQITGVASTLPACLGQVVYKTSLLHLQPRQMTITIVEIQPARPVLSRDPNFTPAPHTSDDGDEFWTSEGDLTGEKKTVEVTVHDAPSLPADDPSYRVEGSAADAGRRSASMESPLTELCETTNEEPGYLSGKHGSTGTVRSRSMSPVCNSLTQPASALKQDSIGSDTRQHAVSTRVGQGARPKAEPGKQHTTSGVISESSRNIIPNSSPRLHRTSSNKNAALPRTNHCNSHSNFQYANTVGVVTHAVTTNRIISIPSSPPVTVGSKKQDTAFKWVDAGSGLEKGTKGTISVEGAWKSEDPIASTLFKDHTALSQLCTGSCATSVGSGTIPLVVDTVKGEGPRWADPASPVTKLIEDGVTDFSSTSVENNLVADCSPTAPNSLDLHRRLYLAQQHFVDTGTPISPSNCPSCLPIQTASGLEMASNPFCVSSLPHFTNQIAHSNTAANSSGFRESASPVSRAAHDMRLSHVGSSAECETSSEPHQEASSVLAQRQVLHHDPPHGLMAVCSNCLSQQTTRSSGGDSCLHSVTGDSFPSIQALPQSDAGLNASDPKHSSHHQCQKSDHQKRTPPSDRDVSFHFVRQTEAIETHPFLRQTFTSADHSHPPSSRLPKDLSSFDKLNLILSEDPSVQNSVHNFRSMPGFVMKNPDLRDDEEEAESSSSERDISENSDEQPTTVHLARNDTLLSNHLHDNEIQQTSASLPSSPIRFGAKHAPNTHTLHEEILKGRCKHLSPLLGRKGRDSFPPPPDFFGVDDHGLNKYESLEVFQKSQLKQKTRHRLYDPCSRMEQTQTFTMHNKAPLWNETSQVYQLDFGGRVTQESAKNFQIELRGKQVMQFGRIDNNAYTLDFQYPFTAVQAFAVALANVTQRLK